MLTYNYEICTFESYLKISECNKGEHSVAAVNCSVFEKMNMELGYNYS